jgi:NAD(P)-dependent dehydrogenase (short-subunit alcohol dehydrogenase family)
MNLQGKVAVVTGAAGHLGRAVAARLGQCGARLVLIDKNPIGAEALVGIKGEHVSCQADVLNPDQLNSVVKDAVASWGHIDVLCHVAGGFRMGDPVHQTSAESWQFLMDLNGRSLIHIANAVVPYMIQEGGKIVTVGAGAAIRGKAFMGAYCASKSSLMRLTESMSAELMDRHINVNCVLPSIIDTPDNRAAMPDADFSRWVSPDALADVIAFLCSDMARAVHGASIPVSGRVSA